MVQSRIFGPKRDEVPRQWRKLHNEELHDLYCSANVNRVIKSRRMRGGTCSTYDRRSTYKVFVGKPKGKNHLENSGVEGRIILK
jgi:sulfite reductase beta subunit-like hemoprotein